MLLKEQLTPRSKGLGSLSNWHARMGLSIKSRKASGVMRLHHAVLLRFRHEGQSHVLVRYQDVGYDWLSNI